MEAFSKKFEVKWADVDPNMHLRHTVYLDFTDQVRFGYFQKHGLTFQRFREMGVGPIIFNMQSSFYKEVLQYEVVTINVKLRKLIPHKGKWWMVHEIFKANGDLAARVYIDGAWLNLKERKLAVPSKEIEEAVLQMERTEDFIMEEMVA